MIILPWQNWSTRWRYAEEREPLLMEEFWTKHLRAYPTSIFHSSWTNSIQFRGLAVFQVPVSHPWLFVSWRLASSRTRRCPTNPYLWLPAVVRCWSVLSAVALRGSWNNRKNSRTNYRASEEVDTLRMESSIWLLILRPPSPEVIPSRSFSFISFSILCPTPPS